MRYSKKLEKIPPYLFIEIDRMKKQAIAEGKDIISFGVGDPDLPTPDFIVQAGQQALAKAENHQYPFGAGSINFRRAVARWYKRRFAVDLNPESEVIALIGSKEGIGHFPLGFVDAGDIVLVPEPGYPVYGNATVFAGGRIYYMPLKEENNFLPDFSRIPESVFRRTKIMFLNYPNNPTSAVCPSDFFKEAIRLAKKYDFIIAHDAAYSEIYFENKPISFLEVTGAKEVGVEFHSLSKTFNMTGWRVGMAVGGEKIISVLTKVKDNYDSGVFTAIQEAATVALDSGDEFAEKNRKIYRQRRDVLATGLKTLGWDFILPPATFYFWVKVPAGYSSFEFTKKIFQEAFVLTTPGSGLGPSGEGYIRLAMTVSSERISEAIERLLKIK